MRARTGLGMPASVGKPQGMAKWELFAFQRPKAATGGAGTALGEIWVTSGVPETSCGWDHQDSVWTLARWRTNQGRHDLPRVTARSHRKKTTSSFHLPNREVFSKT